MSLKTLILAAGKGTRMKSELPKVLHKVCGVPMVQKIVNTCSKIGSIENILILGHKKEEILKVLPDIKYVVQEEQLGTGHAVIQAKEKLKDFDGTVMILCGDTPLLREETLKNLYNYHIETGATTTILTSIYENPFGYGRIVKENGKVIGIVEEKEATKEIKAIKEVNAGVYCFNSKELLIALEKIDNNNEKGEYYLTDVISINVKSGKKVEAFLLEDNNEILGINSKVELEQANSIMRDRINLAHMENGVILIDQKSTYIEESVEIEQDTIIYPGALLQGNTKIGKNCEILGNTRIIDCLIGNNVKIESSVLEESTIEDKVTIGPFAHLRPKSHLKEEVHIGNFVEVKKSTLEKGVKAGHLTYLGDATVGEKTNIGAGTITCNYDGKNKFKTTIGKNAFIGSDTMLVAPINIGENALVGAGSVITKDVPENALAVSRSKQVIKFDWRK
ncbi:bifunctional UDP-N-acetylglucosamine diphosphorylase/glucosamine-1-phosphate N-acetyltransferase GlmU [Cetobacterium somerae]|uniref:bifunctional UDP-N-acetylglucosamine diphosphorylase/glucosamine-1-phosphate N-acetyltransferase GlmU n=1 Tax=Cetobacterium sp. NK01 TaxID=2993530 RepID=UPI00211717AD|nr:bifunctional UDP-N-acetylglucosamine diphosphorylase/glucosamine-1-phosphate N-acetyltransferase GlmU [Cetobacterium sp. NK01]MCQ8211717.1 bifunctional UDP-N-acetylglucosamine diphosphorylase/glucosamine-1-phosphate N-acetyltransferase GlmU [Cetobacterium sp. NK01]